MRFFGSRRTLAALRGNLKDFPSLAPFFSSLGPESNTPLSSRSPYLSPLSIAPSSSPFLLSNHWFFCASIKYLPCVGRLLSLGIWGWGGLIILKGSGEKGWRSGRGGKAKGVERGEERKRQIRAMEVHPKSWHEYQCFTLKQLPIINKQSYR